MTSLARFATIVAAPLALFALAACITQPAEPPPPPPEPDPPTMDIWRAAGEGDIAELEAHKHAGTDLDSQAPEIRITALTIAAIADQLEATRWLLDNGANVNATNGDGGNALGAAAFLGRAEIAELLIEAGIDTSARSSEGTSAADAARTDWGTTEYIAAMLQLDVDRETVEAGRAKIIAMLGDGSTGGGFDELAVAIINNDAAAVKAALAGGADVNSRNPDMGSTPLIVAAFVGRAEIAKMLIAAGADINATDNNGSNALAVAELDWQTTEDIAAALQVPLTDPDAIKKGKAQIAKMLRAKN